MARNCWRGSRQERPPKVYSIFDRYGFWSVAIGAISPPPVPIVAFLIAAGAMHYPRRNFLAALALGRGRAIHSWPIWASIYGRQIIGWLGRYYEPLLYALIAMAVVGGLTGLYFWWRYRRLNKNRRGTKAPGPMHDAA